MGVGVQINSVRKTAEGFKVSGRYVCMEFALFEGERVIEKGVFEGML